MRISVLSDENGKIIATVRPADEHLHLRVSSGQKVHQINLPEELEHLPSLVSLHRTHKVEVSGRDARLVARH